MKIKLAIHGGPKAKSTPFHCPNRYGSEEMAELQQVIESGRMMGPGGKVREFEETIQAAYQVKHAFMVSSGTAALHTALTALGVTEGDEVITTPMTDMGTVNAILALHAIPVFADIDLGTRLISPADAQRRITERTKVIITVHMAGNVCDMDAFLRISREKGVKILEDCAQAHGARYKGRFVGGIGHAGAFSMNESKQISCGDGGYVTTNDDEAGAVALMFRDKAYNRKIKSPRGQEPVPFFGLNYRGTCLQAAVALCQLRKLPENVARRRAIAKVYFSELDGLKSLDLPKVLDGAEPSWWPLPVRYTADNPTRDAVVSALNAEGISVDTGMSPANNIMRTILFMKKRYYPLSDRIPAFWRNTVYDPQSCPNVDELQRTVLRLPLDNRYSDTDIQETVAAIHKVWNGLIMPR